MKKNLFMGGGAALVLIVVIVIIASVAGGGDGNSASQDAEHRKVQAGFHCLNEWDGNHDRFEELVRDTLNDPGSMETHETRITPVRPGTRQHAIFMEFGARNEYGGMVRSEAVGFVNHDTCGATLVGIE